MSTADEATYEWGIVGGGVAGIFLSEILTREGHSAVLIDKNDLLGAETTRDFHEWIHMGSLYTLIPDNLMTLKFLLGAIDDLLDYYGGYPGMNLVPTERGMTMQERAGAWFSQNYIRFRFRIAQRKLAVPWLLGVARSIFLIDRIKDHDWLRRRGGVLDPYRLRPREVLRIFAKLLWHPSKFYDYQTPDFTTNSRNLLNDILLAARRNHLRISTSNEFLGYQKEGASLRVTGSRESFKVRNLVFANGENIVRQIAAHLKVSYAPMAVVGRVSRDTGSFVELDYFPKNCINILMKEEGVALVGGISFTDFGACGAYLDEVIEKHREYNPRLEVLHRYVGKKSEIILNKQDNRNYLYHILNIEENVWGVIPGKFTLAFSVAPEFYRRVYKKNPAKLNPAAGSTVPFPTVVANTVWYDAARSRTSDGAEQSPWE